ncbi:MAG: hypothetical protein ABSF64_25570, partial [Bryobacteraceae bacterium]
MRLAVEGLVWYAKFTTPPATLTIVSQERSLEAVMGVFAGRTCAVTEPDPAAAPTVKLVALKE